LRATVGLLVLEPLLMYAASFVLNGAINWPASLGEPARVNLPLIRSSAARWCLATALIWLTHC
jgi:hypothetical protein